MSDYLCNLTTGSNSGTNLTLTGSSSSSWPYWTDPNWTISWPYWIQPSNPVIYINVPPLDTKMEKLEVHESKLFSLEVSVDKRVDKVTYTIKTPGVPKDKIRIFSSEKEIKIATINAEGNEDKHATLFMNDSYDMEHITVTYADGLLTILVPLKGNAILIP